uniref:WW domain-containing protein n=1 Tax=Hemiselmis andersenii TaxID=464988 RepID=A0A6U4N277_HEMAN
MSQEVQYQLMEAAGLKPGPNVSLALAVDKFRREKTKEVLLYIFFLFLFTTSTYLQRDVTDAHAYLTEVKTSILDEPFPGLTYRKRFEDIRTEDDLWLYLNNVIPNYLFEKSDGAIDFVLAVNVVVQAPRLRQVRVKKLPGSSCRLVPRIDEIETCFPPYSDANQETEPIFGWPPGRMIPYSTSTDLNTAWYGTGILAYDGGGYALDFPLNTTRNEMVAAMQYLRQNRWTDTQTRALFFDFVMFNPMERFFLSCRLLFEFLPYGRIHTVPSFRVMRIGLDSNRDYAVFVLDGMTYCMIVYYIYKDFQTWQFLGGARYWKAKWHWLNWIIYSIFTVAAVFKLRYWLISFQWTRGDPSLDATQAVFDFEAHGWTYSQIWNWTAFNSIFVWLKAFGYFKYVGDRMSHLASTVIQASNDISIFLFFFGLVVFAYTQAAHTAFGTDVASHRSLANSFFQHCFILMRKFEGQFDPVKEINVYLGPILLISFEMLCVFGLSRLTIAILSKHYANMKDVGEDDAMTVEFRTTMYRRLGRARHRFMDFFLWRPRDDVAMFRQERDREMEAIEDRESKPKKRRKKDLGLDPAAVRALQKHLTHVQDGVQVLQDKVGKLYKRYAAHGLVHDDEEEDEGDVANQVQAFEDEIKEVKTQPVPGNKTVLPPTWRVMEGDDGSIFYFNVETRKVQWDPPMVMSAVAPAEEVIEVQDLEEEEA